MYFFQKKNLKKGIESVRRQIMAGTLTCWLMTQRQHQLSFYNDNDDDWKWKKYNINSTISYNLLALYNTPFDPIYKKKVDFFIFID